MNTTRTGKIARLPEAIRQQLNRRLDDGEPGNKLVVWLNGLPEVQAVMTAQFGGRPVREQNLSGWKKGGFAVWLDEQQTLEITKALIQEFTPADAPVEDKLALWLTARFAMIANRLGSAGALTPAHPGRIAGADQQIQPKAPSIALNSTP